MSRQKRILILVESLVLLFLRFDVDLDLLQLLALFRQQFLGLVEVLELQDFALLISADPEAQRLGEIEVPILDIVPYQSLILQLLFQLHHLHLFVSVRPFFIRLLLQNGQGDSVRHLINLGL